MTLLKKTASNFPETTQRKREKKKRNEQIAKLSESHEASNQNGQTIKSPRHCGETKYPKVESNLIQTAPHSPKSRDKAEEQISLASE